MMCMDALNIRENVELASLTTFRIGGPARYFVEVRSEEDVRAALAWAQQNGVPFFVLAGGSNVLVSDSGFDGLVIKVAMDAVRIDAAAHRVTAQAGAVLLDVIERAADAGLGGMEAMAGIPGTIGGAVRGNAGAFGTEMKDVVATVTALNTQTGEVRTFSNEACQFAYRQSFFKAHAEWFILSATLALTPVEPAESRAQIAATIAEREKRHLQNVRAAGSFFMNPVAPPDVVAQFERDKGVESRGGRVPAGWLIEQVEMKGKQIGGALCSPQHPNYIVNASGGATAEEVIMLGSMIKMRVRDRMGVQLREEVTMVGF